MKQINLQRHIKDFFFCVSFLIIGLLFFLTEPKVVNASSMENSKTLTPLIVEHIRLSVPSENRGAWLMAEEKTWEPWLSSKEGFLNRELLWDKEHEEATLLIRWSSREKWKSIPQQDIENTQELFEKIARDLTGKEFGNPFPITFEGELFPQ